MKPVPQAIQLGAFTYAIKRFDQTGDEASWIELDKQIIWLGDKLHPQQAAYWLLHEIMDIRLRELDGKDVETADLTRAVLDIWSQNPEVVAWIMAGLVDSKQPPQERSATIDDVVRMMADDNFKFPDAITDKLVEYYDGKKPLAGAEPVGNRDAAKSIWWKEPVYASVDGITTTDNPYKVAVGWKAYPITAEDLGTLKKLKLSANEACEEGLGGIVDDRFTFLPHIIHDSIDGERFIMTQSTWNTIMDKIGLPEAALKDGYATIKNGVMRLDGPQKLGQETF